MDYVKVYVGFVSSVGILGAYHEMTITTVDPHVTSRPGEFNLEILEDFFSLFPENLSYGLNLLEPFEVLGKRVNRTSCSQQFGYSQSGERA
jgi:hypothetical protein